MNQDLLDLFSYDNIYFLFFYGDVKNWIFFSKKKIKKLKSLYKYIILLT